MNERQLYVVIDLRAKTLMGPIVYSTSPVQIIREVQDAANNRETTIGKYPDDFAIYRIGEIDTENGQITEEPPQLITTAKALVHSADGQ